MSKRLEILKGSLEKKENLFTEKLDSHFQDVKRGNGQPMNDKRNGQATLNRWEKQNDSLRNVQAGIEKTKQAIENEEADLKYMKAVKEQLPAELVALLDSGELTQWKKYPNMLFIPGVDKVRIVWDLKKKQLYHKYASAVTDKEQRAKLISIYNPLNAVLNKPKGA